MIELRRIFWHIEEVFHEFGPPPSAPLRRGAIAAVIKNEFAGRYEENLAPFMDELKPLGLDLAKRLLRALDRPAAAIQGYGKAAIVGADGELEHGALWHAPGGYGQRARHRAFHQEGWRSRHGNRCADDACECELRAQPPGCHRSARGGRALRGRGGIYPGDELRTARARTPRRPARRRNRTLGWSEVMESSVGQVSRGF